MEPSESQKAEMTRKINKALRDVRKALKRLDHGLSQMAILEYLLAEVYKCAARDNPNFVEQFAFKQIGDLSLEPEPTKNN